MMDIRKNIIRIIAAIAAIALPVTANAALTAAQVLNRTAQKLAEAPSITAKFVATNGDGASDHGSLTIAKDRFFMVTGAGAAWFDGESLWSYSKAACETSLSTPTQDELLEINPFKIVSSASTRFKSRMVSSAGGKYVVELTPKTKSSGITKALVTIDAKTFMPLGIDATFASSARMMVKISSTTQGKTLPKGTFQYPAAKYPGVEVIDLR